MSHLMRRWADAEVGCWQGFDGLIPPPYDTTFIFHVDNGRVWYEGNLSVLPSVYAHRVEMHVKSFERAIRRHGFHRDIIFAVDLRDEACARNYPCFSFQKKTDSNIILLPDALVDPAPIFVDRPYIAKANRAIFVGSTSGYGHLTLKNFEANPRVKAAAAFLGRSDVEFRLPNVVQCDMDVQRLAQFDPRFSGGHSSYEEQLKNRFIISMDGNGATCSRVTIALRSNSVLLKYKSNNELFYFKGLEAWRHYVPISEHSEVIDTIKRECRSPLVHSVIAEASESFASTYLSELALETYIIETFRAYSELMAK